MNRFLIVILLLAALLFPITAAAFLFQGNIPSAAGSIARELDKQLMTRYSGAEATDTSQWKRRNIARSNITIMGTTPVNINNLEQSCPLARQMTEEISTKLMSEGYRYQELRKGSFIRFDRNSGEFALTREVRRLAQRRGTGQAILVGTYVISGRAVRFSMSLVHADSNEVLAKASATVPITDDLLPLLDEDKIGGRGGGGSSVPKTYTRLQ